MPNEVPADIIRQLARLFSDLVHVVLSKVPLSGLIRRLQIFDTLGLAHSQKEAAIGQRGDPLGQPEQILLYLSLKKLV